MQTETGRRINEVAGKLAGRRMSKRLERKRDAAYIRSTKELDPDTPLPLRSKRRSA